MQVSMAYLASTQIIFKPLFTYKIT